MRLRNKEIDIMKKYINPKILFSLYLKDDIMTASYDKTDFNINDDNLGDDIFF